MDASTVSSTPVSPPPPSFLDTYSLSMSSLGCDALCMVISFLVLSVHLFKFISGPLEKGSRIFNKWYCPSIYSFWWGFCRWILSRVVFSHSPQIFLSDLVFHLHLFDGCQPPRYRSISRLHFPPIVLILSWFDPISHMSFCHFSWRAWHIFLCHISFLCPDCIFLTAFKRVSSSFFFFCI